MRFIRPLLVAVLVPVLLAAGPADVSELLEPIWKKHDIPGMAAAIVVGNEVTAIGAAGVRRAGADSKVTAQDIWHLGSCTKAMTATMIGTLVEEKKLRWDSTVGEVFADIKVHPECRGITLEQLLTHRAGLVANPKKAADFEKLRSMNDRTTEARRWLTGMVLAEKPEHEPGTKFLYSNVGYMIAGHMAERATGKSWEALMRERLFGPLGMASAGFGAPGVKGKLDQPRGHVKDNKVIEPGAAESDNPLAYGPAGTVHASLADWGKFVSLHLRAAQGDCKLLTPETFKKLQMPFVGKEADKEKYAMGWGLHERGWGDGTVMSHSGSNTMWYCVTWISPKRNFAVLIVSNDGEGAKATDEAAGGLIQHHLAKK